MTAAEMPAFEALLLSKGHSPNGVATDVAAVTQPRWGCEVFASPLTQGCRFASTLAGLETAASLGLNKS